MARPALALLVSIGVVLSTSAQAATPPDGVPKRPEKYNVPEASALIGQADAHYNRGDYTAALETYTRAYQKAALREASLGLALSYANLGKLDEAIWFCSEVKKWDSRSGERAECDALLREFAQLKQQPVDASRCKSKPAACRADAEVFAGGTDGKPPRPLQALLLFRAACDAGDGAGCARAAALQKYGVTVGKRPREQFSSTVQLFRKACELGEANACGQLGSWVVDKSEFSTDATETEIAAYLQSRCDKEPRACSGIGVLYNASKTRTMTRDQARALTLFTKACEAGGAHGCNQAARRFSADKSMQDIKKAIALYDRACSGGDGTGCNNLGISYFEGREGLPKDPAMAQKAFTRGCEIGELKGCDWLGVMAQKGVGVEKDVAKALAIYDKGCAAGLSPTCIDLGNIYTNGNLAPKDAARGFDYYQRGCDLKNYAACKLVANTSDPRLQADSNSVKQDAYSLMACWAGHLEACHEYGLELVRARSSEFDGRQPLSRLFRRACDGGLREACVWAIRKELSEDPKNERTALPELTRLCEGKDAEACKFLEEWRVAHPAIVPIATKQEFEEKRKAGDVSGLNLDAYSLAGQNLSGLSMKKTRLNGALLGGAKLANANLAGAELKNADLRGADLSGADLTDADLQGAQLVGATLTGAILKGAGFREANLQKVDFRETKFMGVVLSGADLRGANLSGMRFDSRTDSFRACKLDNANLKDTTFARTNLGDADFQLVDLTNTKFESVSFSSLHVTLAQVQANTFSIESVSTLHVHADRCYTNAENWRLQFRATTVTQYFNGVKCP